MNISKKFLSIWFILSIGIMAFMGYKVTMEIGQFWAYIYWVGYFGLLALPFKFIEEVNNANKPKNR